MPGLVEMENGVRDGPAKGVKDKSATSANGAGDLAKSPRMNDLPDEIVHITQGYIPLSLLLTRLAQTTHNALQDKVMDLAKLPPPAASLNGNGHASTSDDTSVENLKKKASLLSFAQDTHAKWVKALVITEWSRKSEMVSKLIDIKAHIDGQRRVYDAGLDYMINVKRDLTYARLPNPDLKTSLQVLSTGSGSWMPDLNYIEPDPLTPEEQLKWIDELNTLLSIRLNLDEFDKIPHHFKDYTIDNGRVTFRVKGEFEVDLTIADEDFEKQFWFIDFRFDFSPSSADVSETLKTFLELHTNAALADKGLLGCYQFLHEFVLTHKINELKRQAVELNRTSWTQTLVVEPLNRALAIQYWSSRGSADAPKSWVLVAVNSGRKGSGREDLRSTSHLCVKWYRNGKEVKDVDIAISVDHLSAEKLLMAAIGKHIWYLLSSIHQKLVAAPRFQSGDISAAVSAAEVAPEDMSLEVRIGTPDPLKVMVEPITGAFSLGPQSRTSFYDENRLNTCKNPAEEGVVFLESLRWRIMVDELSRKGSSVGWKSTVRLPFSTESTRAIIKPRGPFHSVCFQRQGWPANWYLMVSMGLGGDDWWLLEGAQSDTPQPPTFYTKLDPSVSRKLFDRSFWHQFTIFASGLMCQSVDLREMHRRKMRYTLRESEALSTLQHVRLPALVVSLASILPPKEGPAGRGPDEGGIDRAGSRQGQVLSPSASQSWAHNNVEVRFKSVILPPRVPDDSSKDEWTSPPAPASTGAGTLHYVSDATVRVRFPKKFQSLRGMSDEDVYYDARRGQFRFRIQLPVGTSVLESLATRLKAVDRLVRFVDALSRAKDKVVRESVSLREVSFIYQEDRGQTTAADDTKLPRRLLVRLDLSREQISIRLEAGNPHLRILDLLTRLVNSNNGIENLMAWLPLSLELLASVDIISQKCEDDQSRFKVELAAKSLDWFTIRYRIADGSGRKRCLDIDACMRIRDGAPIWFLSGPVPGLLQMRSGDPGKAEAPKDAFTLVLKRVWDASGVRWRGIGSGAAAEPIGGISHLLMAIDEVIRAFVKATLRSGAATAATAGVPPQTEPEAQARRPGLPGPARNANPPNVVVLD